VIDLVDESQLPDELRTLPTEAFDPPATPWAPKIITLGGEAEREEIRRRSAALKNEVLAWCRAHSEPTPGGANAYSEWAKEMVARSRMNEATQRQGYRPDPRWSQAIHRRYR
jgi:hypothetical protein